MAAPTNLKRAVSSSRSTSLEQVSKELWRFKAHYIVIFMLGPIFVYLSQYSLHFCLVDLFHIEKDHTYHPLISHCVHLVSRNDFLRRFNGIDFISPVSFLEGYYYTPFLKLNNILIWIETYQTSILKKQRVNINSINYKN